MKKEEIIKLLKKFPYDKNDYWVIMGGAMVLYGFREETSDIDLGCNKIMADKLEEEGYLCEVENNGNRNFKIGSEIEVFENWLYDGVSYVSDTPVITINGLIMMKELLGREKDQKDIKLIKKALKKRS